jgi:hypothetical protein
LESSSSEEDTSPDSVAAALLRRDPSPVPVARDDGRDVFVFACGDMARVAGRASLDALLGDAVLGDMNPLRLRLNPLLCPKTDMVSVGWMAALFDVCVCCNARFWALNAPRAFCVKRATTA